MKDKKTDERYGDAEYLRIFLLYVMPVMRNYKPGVVMVSLGFDAAEGDPYGAMDVSPRGYYYMLNLLAKVCRKMEIPLVVVFEGGYNPTALEKSAAGAMTGFIETVEPYGTSAFVHLYGCDLERVPSLTRPASPQTLCPALHVA